MRKQVWKEIVLYDNISPIDSINIILLIRAVNRPAYIHVSETIDETVNGGKEIAILN